MLVDAEYTYMNPALTLVTMALMKKFNKDGAWIWNTYQCYLKAVVKIDGSTTSTNIWEFLLFTLTDGMWQVSHLSTRTPGLCCWRLSICHRLKVSVWESNWYEVHTWTKSESWQRRSAGWTPFTRAGKRPTRGWMNSK